MNGTNFTDYVGDVSDFSSFLFVSGFWQFHIVLISSKLGETGTKVVPLTLLLIYSELRETITKAVPSTLVLIFSKLRETRTKVVPSTLALHYSKDWSQFK
jgi:hypothetical protein